MASQNRHGRFFPSEDAKIIREYKELSAKEVLHIKKYLAELYDVDTKFLSQYMFLKRGDDVWITTKKSSTILNYSKTYLKINSIGFRAIRNTFTTTPKITTNFAQFLANRIRKNVYELNREELEKYIRGYGLDVNPELELRSYCVLTYKGKVIGVGQCKDGAIKNQIPKGRTLHRVLIN